MPSVEWWPQSSGLTLITSGDFCHQVPLGEVGLVALQVMHAAKPPCKTIAYRISVIKIMEYVNDISRGVPGKIVGSGGSHCLSPNNGMNRRKSLSYHGKYTSPTDLLRDETLSHDQKVEMLNQWREDEEALQRATEEGMEGGERPDLKRVQNALNTLLEGST